MENIGSGVPDPRSRQHAPQLRGTAAAWAAIAGLATLTIIVLALPARILIGAYPITSLPPRHGQHSVVFDLAVLIIFCPAGGAVLAGLATLPARKMPVVARVAVMTAGALLGSLALTIGGYLWLLAHSQWTF